ISPFATKTSGRSRSIAPKIRYPPSVAFRQKRCPPTSPPTTMRTAARAPERGAVRKEPTGPVAPVDSRVGGRRPRISRLTVPSGPIVAGAERALRKRRDAAHWNRTGVRAGRAHNTADVARTSPLPTSAEIVAGSTAGAALPLVVPTAAPE